MTRYMLIDCVRGTLSVGFGCSRRLSKYVSGFPMSAVRRPIMSVGDATRADIEKELTKLIEAAREELACGNQFGYEALHEQIDLLLTDRERYGVKA